MMNENKFVFWRSTAVLIGTIIGAGIFGLPYAFSKIGFIPGAVYLIVLATVLLIANFCYAETILRTKDKLEMAGYVNRYLGKVGKIIISCSLILGNYAALTAYLIGAGGFLFFLLNPILGGSQIFWSLLFWVLASLLILRGSAALSKAELFMTIGLVACVAFISFLAYPHLSMNNILATDISNLKDLFFPYGAALFALGGASALPTMRKVLGDKIKLFKKSVFLGTLIPLIIYIIFCFIILGVSGGSVSETALEGMVKFAGKEIMLIGGCFGVLAISTSFLALGHLLREVYHHDYNFSLFPAWLLAVSVPGILFLVGLRSFITIIGFTGGVLSGLQGIMLIITYYQAKKKGDRIPEFKFSLPKPVAYFIYLIFFLGIVYQFLYV
jgi:tyrosine-specific transport protein